MQNELNKMYTLEKLSGMEQKLYFTLEAEDERVVNAQRVMKTLNVSQMHAYNLLKNMYEKEALDKVKVAADSLGLTISKKPFSYILDRFLLRYRSSQGLRDSYSLTRSVPLHTHRLLE